jgi:hypothetical protein
VAYEVLLGGAESRAKVRNPWMVLALSILTAGIYTCVWWYFINRELALFGRSKRTDILGAAPWQSAAAFALGYVIFPGLFVLTTDSGIAPIIFWIPMIWTVVTTTRRLQDAQRLAGMKDPLSGWVASAAWILTLTAGGPPYTQWHLNRIWEREPKLVPRETTLPTQATDIDRLERLSALRSAGALTDEEFAVEKAQVMRPSNSHEPGSVDRILGKTSNDRSDSQ